MTQTCNARDQLLRIKNLNVSFVQHNRTTAVLHGIDLDILKGESLGMVGESGCGKSVTWLACLGLLGSKAIQKGSIALNGQELLNAEATEITKVRGKRIAMIFQDPTSCLNPSHRIGSQICESLALHRGLKGEAATTEAIRLLERVHIPNASQRLRAYPHELSGGMNQRVMIAMALAGEPELLIADEPTTALDATVQAQIIDLLNEIRRDSGMTLVVISHDLGVISAIAQRVVVMYAGRIVETVDTNALFSSAAHPYTRGLLAAMPTLDSKSDRLRTIQGSVPEPGKLTIGCSFSPRCNDASAHCHKNSPASVQIKPGHRVCCLNTPIQ